MKTKIMRIDPAAVEPRLLEEIASVLLADGVMAYPTETFYGLGAAAFSAGAVSKIYRLKGRDSGKALSLIASDLDMVRRIAGEPAPAFLALAEEFWPGPLTIVLKASASLPGFLRGPGASVAVRVPPVAWIRKLARELSQPLTATSANLSGGEAVSDAAGAAAVFEGKIELIVDGGQTPGGAPSTIVDITGAEPRILRPGVIPEEKIRAVLGR